MPNLQQQKQSMAQRMMGGIGSAINGIGQDASVIGNVIGGAIKNTYTPKKPKQVAYSPKPQPQNMGTTIKNNLANQQNQINQISKLTK